MQVFDAPYSLDWGTDLLKWQIGTTHLLKDYLSKDRKTHSTVRQWCFYLHRMDPPRQLFSLTRCGVRTVQKYMMRMQTNTIRKKDYKYDDGVCEYDERISYTFWYMQREVIQHRYIWTIGIRERHMVEIDTHGRSWSRRYRGGRRCGWTSESSSLSKPLSLRFFVVQFGNRGSDRGSRCAGSRSIV